MDGAELAETPKEDYKRERHRNIGRNHHLISINIMPAHNIQDTAR
jgi:hypothetical protein